MNRLGIKPIDKNQLDKNYYYGLVGNCRSAAIISAVGTVEWLCLPNFDSEAAFAALLDPKKGGSFGIEVTDDYQITQKYLRNTNILSTRFDNGQDTFDVLDFMPRYRGHDTFHYPPELIRYFHYLRGKPQFKCKFDPKMNYGKETDFTTIQDFIKAHSKDKRDYESLYAYSDFDLDFIMEGKTLTLREDHFVMVSYHQKLISPNLDNVFLVMEKTRAYWLDWTSRTKKYSSYYEEIVRSALTLKMLSFEPTGAVLAAATTSLPESIGETRNWDYRFCWVRDASMTISTFIELDHLATVKSFIRYFINLIAFKTDAIQIVYDIHGKRNLQEKQLDHLSGYQGSSPVRIGNAAFRQKQHDIFGIVLDVIDKSIKYAVDHTYDLENMWTIVRTLVRHVKKQWKTPDKGIWEYRDNKRHFVFSKLLCWVAVDRAIKIGEKLNQIGLTESWSLLREEIKADILSKGWNSKVGAFTQYYGSDEMDAANLLMHEYGFIEATDKRFIATVKQTESELCKDGLMYRYKNEDDFGAPKSSFTICTFWMINSLQSIGETEKAKKMFETLLTYSNHLGLFAEDINFKTKRLLGNFPQAYSHLALIATAIKLGDGKTEMNNYDKPFPFRTPQKEVK